jgi:adenine-specific DNA-methyltransferase
MTQKDKFTEAGFSLIETDSNTVENKLINFLKENYPQVIRDGEINLSELRTVAGLPIDEKVNGYGLNFIGRNVARAKYDQKTAKELKINSQFSRDFDKTQNMVLKGDNLDCLKILKSYYNGQIKCIYIDPPYNTDSDNFVYPDKFDKEEQEVLGLANLSESDMDRLEFSFKTKKSHNGWLTFMYPRLMLARDLLADDGVLFVSIDDNEQANLKLLCDEIFDEENFFSQLIIRTNSRGQTYKQIAKTHEYVIVYTKSDETELFELEKDENNSDLNYTDNISSYNIRELRNRNPKFGKHNRPNLFYPIYINVKKVDKEGFHPISLEYSEEYCVRTEPRNSEGKESCWRWSKNRVLKNISTDTLNSNLIAKVKSDGNYNIYEKYRKTTYKPKSIWDDNSFLTETGTIEVKSLGFNAEFDFPKPLNLIKQLIKLSSENGDIILDFFAGSGTTAQAVMQLNGEGGDNRKFILCQIDEPIKEDKPAYKFCVENGLPPFISSITCERIKRAGDKIRKEIEEENAKSGLFEENKKEIPDIGFKVFDLTDAPKLELKDGQIIFQNTDNDTLSRIYNMIFQVGIDNPTETLECVLENCLYKIGGNYYITNATELDKAENKHFLSDAIKNGRVFIDGWTASINTTLQNYKEDVKIVF